MLAVEILLIEDNAGDAIVIRQALERCPIPVHLHIARDGEQALTMLTNPAFQLDLIILDLNIPKITGTVLLERWQAGKIPVVVFSSSPRPAEQARCLALGAREFIAKPTDLKEFTEAVCRIVNKWVVPKEAGA